MTDSAYPVAVNTRDALVALTSDDPIMDIAGKLYTGTADDPVPVYRLRERSEPEGVAET